MVRINFVVFFLRAIVSLVLNLFVKYPRSVKIFILTLSQNLMNRHINFDGHVKRYNHNLSYRNFISGEIGEMRPVWLEDGVPGDTFQYHPEVRMYFSPLVFPVLTNMKARIDVFFVPNRIAWSEWESFLTGGPENNLDPSYPSVRNVYAACEAAGTDTLFDQWYLSEVTDVNSLLSNLGHPTFSSYSQNDEELDPYDLLPLYDFLLIWDEWYRDEEKEQSRTAPNGVRLDVYDFFVGQNYSSLFAGLPRIAWAKDYFTTASLEQQRGGDLPLLSSPFLQFSDGSSYSSSGQPILLAGSSGNFIPGSLVSYDSSSSSKALESVLTVNGLRYLFSAADWMNNNVIGGTRYVEQLRRRYKVVSSDARLQRPEMVGSIDINVNIDIVTQTSSTVEDAESVQALGDRAGQASIVGSGKTITYSCEEFGWFIGILHVAPKAAYFQGIRRNLQREDKFDFFMPEFQFVPQREIRNNEIYADPSHLSPEDGGVFGYASQYSELKHHNDEVHGDFQDSLLAWTMARKFSSLPSVASEAFLRVDSDPEGNNRIFAVPDSEFSHIFGVVNNIVTAKREVSNREPHF